jgi:arabinofuranan 3-O-arabinosyltransferase
MSVRTPVLDGSDAREPHPASPAAGQPDLVADETLSRGSGGPIRGHGAVRLQSPLRMVGYAAIITALCFIQSPGRMVADTKFDLLTEPWAFLERGLRLWDPNAAFGQVPDQSYGYVWPMGPFFALGHLLAMPPWMIQRLWWALLLCLAFFGMLRLLRAFGIGTDLSQLVAATAFVLTPRFTSLVGVVSVELWPMALAPWVLLPLVRGSHEGSVRRAAARSALVVACCGGVNAVAVAAVLPLGVVWLLTREAGPRRWRMLGWWTGFTVLATVWWSGPLLLLGRYAPPFLDYIENAAITTLPTDLTRTLLGVSTWTAYFGGPDFQGGLSIVGTPYLLVDAAAVAALGLLGMCLSGNPHRRFLVWGLLSGLLLVGFGYARDLPGFLATLRQDALDGVLAPLRNVHKFDVVLRIPLVLGLAHAVAELPRMVRAIGSVVTFRVFRAGLALAVAALVMPWLTGVIPASGGVKEVPGYWRQTADYLASRDDGSVALELPASPFGVYQWGNTHDDVLQGLAQSPWAVRNVVPLAQPGNVVLLDAITRAVESGRPLPRLASSLASNNVGTLVVRNDLDRVLTGAPDPAYLRAVLTATPGIRLVRSFGPFVGLKPYDYALDGRTRLVQGSGLSQVLRAIDVYEVTTPAGATLSDPGAVLVGDPGSAIDQALADIPVVARPLAADADRATSQILTDDLKRREMNFPAVRWNESATMTPDDQFRLQGRERSHRLVEDDARWSTVETWSGGVAGVSASSSQAYADATPPLAVGEHPGAVFDHDTTTAWVSAHDSDPKGQWWQVRFTEPRTVSRVGVTLGETSVPLTSLVISGGGQERTVFAPKPGDSASYAVGLPSTSTLRITAVYAGARLTGPVSISEVAVDGLNPSRALVLPAPADGVPVDVVAMSRDPDRFPCVDVEQALVCDGLLSGRGEDGDTLDRKLSLTRSAGYDFAATASLRRTDEAWSTLLAGTGVGIAVTPARDGDPANGPGAMADGDPSTTWISSSTKPSIELRLPRATTLSTIGMSINPGAAASPPQRLVVSSRGRHRVVDLVDGTAELPHWTVRRLTVDVESTDVAFSDLGGRFVELPPGVSELQVNGSSLTSGLQRTVDVPCGRGPRVAIGSTIYDTRLKAPASDLLRGASVPLGLCGRASGTLAGALDVIGAPTSALRVDSVTLSRKGAETRAVEHAQVDRDANGEPVSVAVPARTAPTVLSLPQNINPGWRATLDGDVLPVRRIDGWQQGWLLPAGAAGTVRLEFTPTRTFDAVLVVGAALALLVGLAATPLAWSRRRTRRLPPLQSGRPGRIDLALVTVTAGLLTGFVGLAVVGGAVVLARRLPRFDGWGQVAAVALLLAAAGLTWGPLKSQSWVVYWAQIWSMVAIAVVAVTALGPRWSTVRGRSTTEPGARSSGGS